MRLGAGQWAAVVVLALTGVAAFGIAPDTSLETDLPLRTVVTPLPLPAMQPLADPGSPYWREERVQRGDTIGSLLARAGVDDPLAMSFLRIDARARALYQLKPGRPVRVATDERGQLQALRFVTSTNDVLSVRRANGAFLATYEPTREAVRLTLVTAQIGTSLFATADAVGIPDAITANLVELFAGDIDFLKDIRKGDRFSVLYETRSVEGEPVGTGRIVAAEFENRGLQMSAFLWKDADGDDAWFTLDGRSSRKAFLRTPMEISRITSGFSFARFHPILQEWRAHKGVDYAAPEGTPVRVTADGVVASAGTQNGYGNVIVVRHQGAYSTLYAHLSRFQRMYLPGDRVSQGETIGYVGSTGWATGPHLHYEFRINDEARDPMTSAMPVVEPLPPGAFKAFLAHIEPLAQQLKLAREISSVRFASNE
ncbi:MAG TPA: peptidoglycan DD-metalloendopeptidase family protein [Casimicrobiaceae bacterium]|nr:peptidoglycan DD-metalloendopeptidase family protein [Casimicrobiaceae bacterium]